MSALFALGKVIITLPCLDLCRAQEVDYLDLLRRHQHGDYGTMSANDIAMNVSAIKNGDDRIFSSYDLPSGDSIWIITEWDRSATTILLPSDYPPGA